MCVTKGRRRMLWEKKHGCDVWRVNYWTKSILSTLLQIVAYPLNRKLSSSSSCSSPIIPVPPHCFVCLHPLPVDQAVVLSSNHACHRDCFTRWLHTHSTCAHSTSPLPPIPWFYFQSFLSSFLSHTQPITHEGELESQSSNPYYGAHYSYECIPCNSDTYSILGSLQCIECAPYSSSPP